MWSKGNEELCGKDDRLEGKERGGLRKKGRKTTDDWQRQI